MTKHPLNPESSTEEKIKVAAQKVFLQKGFSATRTRDIADEAGENLALINYYFKSKENLYRIIMAETMHDFLNTMIPVFNDENTNLDTKIEKIVENYIHLFIAQPAIPLFVMNELNSGNKSFMNHDEMKAKMLGSVFFMQLMEKMKGMTGTPIHPLQIFMSILGLTVFPFIASPMLKGIGEMTDEQFSQIMQERKRLIPQWVNTILNS